MNKLTEFPQADKLRVLVCWGNQIQEPGFLKYMVDLEYYDGGKSRSGPNNDKQLCYDDLAYVAQFIPGIKYDFRESIAMYNMNLKQHAVQLAHAFGGESKAYALQHFCKMIVNDLDLESKDGVATMRYVIRNANNMDAYFAGAHATVDQHIVTLCDMVKTTYMNMFGNLPNDDYPAKKVTVDKGKGKDKAEDSGMIVDNPTAETEYTGAGVGSGSETIQE